MEFTAAVVKKADSTCVVVIVKKEVVENDLLAAEAVRVFSKFFPLMPIVLMAQNFKGDGIYRGPEDLVKLLNNVRPEDLSWKAYQVASK